MFSSADLIQLLEMFSSCFAVHALTCCMYINNCDRVTSVRNNSCDIVHSLIPLKSSEFSTEREYPTFHVLVPIEPIGGVPHPVFSLSSEQVFNYKLYIFCG